jgi:protein-disulfide isomerase
MKNPWVIVSLIAVVLIGGSVWYSSRVSESNNEGITFSANIKGNQEAAVTLTEYSDFQCPACAAFYFKVEEVLSKYPNDVKLEYKHFPLMSIHPYAEPAARAAEAAAQQGKFFEFADLLFKNQTTWSKSPNPTTVFYKYAEELGLDIELFKRHHNASVVRDRVKEGFNEAVNLGLTGTPTFYLNGEKMEFETYEEFDALIEAAVNPKVEFEVAP